MTAQPRPERRPLGEVQNTVHNNVPTQPALNAKDNVKDPATNQSMPVHVPIAKDHRAIQKPATKKKETGLPKPPAKRRPLKPNTPTTAAPTTSSTITKKSSGTIPRSDPVPQRASATPKPHVGARATANNPAAVAASKRRQTNISADARGGVGPDKETRRRTMMSFTEGNQEKARLAQRRGVVQPGSQANLPRVADEKLSKIADTQVVLLEEVRAQRKEKETASVASAAQMAELSAAHSKAQIEHQVVASELANTRADLAKVRDELAQERAENTRLAMLNEGLAQLDELRASERTLRDSLARIEAEAEAAASKAKSLGIRLSDTEADLARRDGELRRAERERDGARLDADNARVEAEARDKAAREGRTAAESAVVERDAERVAAAALRKELSEARAQATSFESALAEYEARVARLTAEKRTATLQLDTARADADARRAELDAAHELQKETVTEVEALRTQAREDKKTRRHLHNVIQELKGNIRVFCRVRPLPSAKSDTAPPAAQFDYTEKGQGVVAHGIGAGGSKVPSKYNFKFDRVFDPATGQAGVFDEISELVQSALDGYRVCIFAYGQTGSGKTYTMMGPEGSGMVNGALSEGLGVIPRAVRQIFDAAKEAEADGWTYSLKATFLEVYNESVKDLLATDGGSGGAQAQQQTVQHRIAFNEKTKMCTVSDVTTIDVSSETQLQRLIERSMRNRSTAATRANERSSRSHSVFRLAISGSNAATGQRLDGLLNLIDLAGSERLAHSKAEGERLRETRHINKSLSALGDVISALATEEKHIPFRNSKLTHLLQDSLGGDCKTLMFVNLSHAAESFSETLCSLRFAAKVNSCHVGTASRTTRVEL